MNKLAYEMGKVMVKTGGIADVISKLVNEEAPAAFSQWTMPGDEQKSEPPFVASRDLPLAGTIFGGAGGAGIGGAAGAGLGGLLHYLTANEEKRKLSNYLKSILMGGAVGAGIGGLGGAGLGAELGHRAQGYRSGEYDFAE